MNISTQTIETLKSMFTFTFYDNNVNEVKPEHATEIYIGKEIINGKTTDENGFLFHGFNKSIKAPKKEVTIDWILSKLNTEQTFENFCKSFNKIIKGKKLNCYAYPTSYGIGIVVAIGFRNSIEQTKKTIENTLSELNVKYTTEYSEAGYVFRYKISKAKENIQIINSIA